MRCRRVIALAALVAASAACGCVERVLLIRSEPPSAPVYVDEQYAGVTPLEFPFRHYGTRRVRVGPVRDPGGTLLYGPAEQDFRVVAPWYEKWPIDFLAEVLWPGTLRDVHRVPAFTLTEATHEESGEEEARQILERAEAFRSEAGPVPSQQAPAP